MSKENNTHNDSNKMVSISFVTNKKGGRILVPDDGIRLYAEADNEYGAWWYWGFIFNSMVIGTLMGDAW